MNTIAKLSGADVSARLAKLPDWEPGKDAIHGEFGFKDYKQALGFVNKLSELAEEANHHPDVNFGWGYVDITLTTHDADGLTTRDFDLAEKISAILA